MIANISTGNYCRGMVKYNDNKSEKKDEKMKQADLLGVENIPNRDVETIISKIDSRNKLNQNVSKPNIHISLNFHKNDVLNNNEIYKIGLDYMKELGYENQPFAVYRHYDKEHPHIHIVSSQIAADGNKISDSYLYRKSQRITRELEKKYNITIATEQKGNKVENKHLPTLINEHLELGKHSLTGVLGRVLNEVMGKKPTSEKEFENHLKQFQTRRTVYEKDGVAKGHYFHLLTFDQLDEPLIKDKGVSGTDIDSSFSYQFIKKEIEVNDKIKKEGLRNIMGKVYSLTNSINPEAKMKLTDLALALRKKGIELHAKRKQTGNDINGIYGLTFLEKSTGITYTASDLKIKTAEFLKNILDDEKFIKRDDGSSKVYIESKKEVSNDEVPDSIMISNNGFDSILSICKDLFGSIGTQQESDVSLSEKKKRKRRKGNK